MAMHPATPAANTRSQLLIDYSAKPQTPTSKPQDPSPKPQTPKEQPHTEESSNQAHTPPCSCSQSRRAADRSMDSDGPGLAEMAFALDMELDMDDDAAVILDAAVPSVPRRSAMFLDDCSAAPSFGSPSDVTASSFVGLERGEGWMVAERMSQKERAALLALLSNAGPRAESTGKEP